MSTINSCDCPYCGVEVYYGDQHGCKEYKEFLARSIEIAKNDPEIVKMIRVHACNHSYIYTSEKVEGNWVHSRSCTKCYKYEQGIL